MLELHHVKIGQRIGDCSLTVDNGEMMGICGQTGSGKTSLLRAVLGLMPIDGGHITIDGELLTPLSAPYFRRQTAYVPQRLSPVEGFDSDVMLRKVVESLRVNGGKPCANANEQPIMWHQMTAETQYLALVRRATTMHKTLIVADEPSDIISIEARQQAETWLAEAAREGAAVLMVNPLSDIKQLQL